jgi:hypothetical protein
MGWNPLSAFMSTVARTAGTSTSDPMLLVGALLAALALGACYGTARGRCASTRQWHCAGTRDRTIAFVVCSPLVSAGAAFHATPRHCSKPTPRRCFLATLPRTEKRF